MLVGRPFWVRSCLLITLIKCLKGHKSLGSQCNIVKALIVSGAGPTDGQWVLLSCSGQLTKIIYQFLFGEIQLIFIFNFTVYSKSKDTQPKSPATEICRLHLCVLQACWQCWTVFHHLPLFLYCFLRLTFEHFTSKQFPLFWPSSLEFSAETQAVIFLSQNSYGDKG